jgi:hypothetical protein
MGLNMVVLRQHSKPCKHGSSLLQWSMLSSFRSSSAAHSIPAVSVELSSCAFEQCCDLAVIIRVVSVWWI